MSATSSEPAGTSGSGPPPALPLNAVFAIARTRRLGFCWSYHTPTTVVFFASLVATKNHVSSNGERSSAYVWPSSVDRPWSSLNGLAETSERLNRSNV
jgi:hypothetical protein